MDNLVKFTVASILISLSLYWVSKITKRSKKSPPPPQVSGAWPIIGHLHLLGGPQVLHRTLASMADKHGPIFTFNLGVRKVLVVSDSKLAKECYTTNDKAFANRPKSIGVELMCYNYATHGLEPYGPYWRKIKKIIVNDILSKSHMATLERIGVSEIKASMKETYKFWESSNRRNEVAKAEMKEWFGRIVLNMVLKMVLGKRFSSNDEQVKYQKVFKEFTVLLGTFVVGDAVPWLRWLDIGRHEKAMKTIFMEIDFLLQEALEEHKRKRSLVVSGEIEGDINEEKDYMDMMLSILDGVSHEELCGFDPDVVTKATCLTLFQGALHTTVVTLTWAISLLLNNKRALNLVEKELDLHVGKERHVKESDLKNLVYLQAVFKETLRLYPAGPLSLPHESMEDCILGGYYIPKGTRLLFNLFKIHSDPRIWPNPSEFQPERFLTTHKHIDFRGQNYELISFGSGRRVCPGISLAMQNMHLILGSLIHGFELTTILDEPIDMSDGFGITNNKASSTEVLLKPRLPPYLYE